MLMKTIPKLLAIAAIPLITGAWMRHGHVGTAVTVLDIQLSNLSITTSAANANAPVGAVTVLMSNGSTYAGTITLGGTDGSKFVLTNGGALPTNLDIGASNIGVTGVNNYSITLSTP
jgi:hypothetical protein